MIFQLTKNFKKRCRQLPRDVQKKIEERLNLFLENPFDPILNNHALHGEYLGCRSINITGDYRAIYFESPKDHATFLTAGTHSQLFG